jgi:hypothetical protein
LVGIDRMHESFSFLFTQEAIALHVGAGAQPRSRIIDNSCHLPFASQVVEVAQNHDNTVDRTGGIAALPHAIDQISEHFNFPQGLIGAAVGIGASLSTFGYIADMSGAAVVFLSLACIAFAELVFVFALVPETRDTAVVYAD